MVSIRPFGHLSSIFLVITLNYRFVFSVIRTSLYRQKYILTLFLLVFQIDKTIKVKDSIHFLSLKYFPSIVLYGITIRHSTSEY